MPSSLNQASAPGNLEPLRVRTLMGARNIAFSLVCLQSLVAKSERTIRLTVHNDGSLGPDEKASIQEAIAPNVTFVDPTEADDSVLPRRSAYPKIRAYRRRDVLCKKLIDVVLMESSPRVRYCDSDILFFERYDGLFGEAGDGEAMFMRDIRTCYAFGWNTAARQFFPLPSRVNSGLIDYPTRAFDLDLIEHILGGGTFTNKLWEEQTIWAILAGRVRATYPDRMIVPTPTSDPLDSFAWHLVTPMRTVWPMSELVRQTKREAQTYRPPRRSFALASYPTYIGVRTAGGLTRRARNLKARLSG